MEYFCNFFVGGAGLNIAEGVCQKAPVQFYEKLDEQAAAVQFGRIFLTGEGAFQLFAKFKKSMDRGRRSAEYRAGLRFFRLFLETGLQREFFCGEGSQKFRRNIENDPFVGGGGTDDGSVYFPGGDQDDVGGFETVSDTLDKIVHIPGDKEHNLKKIMIVAVVVLHLMVCQVEEPEGFI